ncbi:MAG TPA: hypothetical protein DEP69_02310 [Acidimicrobiaceae bacterium]|nr:hypothetical protein [Acidimicrobiaceae bacterium]
MTATDTAAGAAAAGTTAADLYRTDLPVRDELASAHAEILRRWSAPGTWWTARRRQAIVTQVRAALDADPLPPWVAPSSVEGLLDDDAAGLLPSAAVDAVWRITNYPGTLTRDFYDGVIAAGIEPPAYVELVGVVAQANNLDRFADALGLDRLDLPPPSPGEPSRRIGADVAVANHWVPTAATAVPNVLLALTAVPAEVDAWLLLSDAGYVPIANVRGDLVSDHGSLTRPQIELVATRTSKLDECFY